MTVANRSQDQAPAVQVKKITRNLMIQRFDGSEWVNWCGPTDKRTADYYLSEIVGKRAFKNEFRVVPYKHPSEVK